MLNRAFQHRRNGIFRIVFVFLGGINTAAVDADSDRTVIVACSLDDHLHLVLPGLITFVMVQGGLGCSEACRRVARRPMPGDSSLARSTDRFAEVCLRISATASASFLLSTAMRTDVGTSVGHQVDQELRSRRYVLSLGGGHRLNGN